MCVLILIMILTQVLPGVMAQDTENKTLSHNRNVLDELKSICQTKISEQIGSAGLKAAQKKKDLKAICEKIPVHKQAIFYDFLCSSTPSKGSICISGVEIYSPAWLLRQLNDQELIPNKELLEFGLLVFGDTGGPTIFALGVDDGKIYDLWHGHIEVYEKNVYFDLYENNVWVGSELKPLTAENIRLSAKTTWDSFEDFATDLINDSIPK